MYRSVIIGRLNVAVMRNPHNKRLNHWGFFKNRDVIAGHIRISSFALAADWERR